MYRVTSLGSSSEWVDRLKGSRGVDDVGSMAWFTKDRSTHPADNAVESFDRMIRELARTHAPAAVRVEEGEGDSLRIGDITTNLANLRRAWAEHAPEARLPWLERSVIGFLQHEPIPATLDTTHLRPGVRSRTTFELAGLRLGLDSEGFVSGNEPAMAPIAADLAWVLIWDTPATMGTVNQAQIEQWGVEFDELLAIAKSNLAMEPFLGWGGMDERIFSPVGVDDYDGTRVFLPGALDFLPFADERVVFQPTRTTSLVVSAGDEEALAAAAHLALKEVDSANQVSFTPVVGFEGLWRPLVLEPTHAAYQDWRRLVALDRLYGYEAQKMLLEQQLGEDLFVAKYAAVESGMQGTTSYCTWSSGIPTLLPASDVVAFYREDDDTFLVPWDVVVELVGHLLEPTNHYPERYRVVEFPTEQEINELRALSTTI